MRKIAPKSIIDFIRKRSPKGKRNFVNRLKLPMPLKGNNEGGDYWSSCSAAICNSFKGDDASLMPKKILELQEKIRVAKREQTKNRHQKNIDILNAVMHYDFTRLRSSKAISFIKKTGSNPILKFADLEVNADSKQLYIVSNEETKAIGAVWFITKLGGYNKKELGIFTDILFRYLRQNFSPKHALDSKYCIAFDVVNLQYVNYAQIEKGLIPALLNPTLDEIRRLLRGGS